jgi:hypothetical protein
VKAQAIEEVSRKTIGYFSGIYTQYNPEFAISNFTRDFLLASITLPAKEGPVFAGNFVKNVMNPLTKGAIGRYAAGIPDLNHESDRMLQEFLEDGAATGYNFLKHIDELQTALSRQADGNSFVKTFDATNRVVKSLLIFWATI